MSWPKYPNGEPKTFGDMTREEKKVVLKEACANVKAHFEHPEVMAHIKKVLDEA